MLQMKREETLFVQMLLIIDKDLDIKLDDANEKRSNNLCSNVEVEFDKWPIVMLNVEDRMEIIES